MQNLTEFHLLVAGEPKLDSMVDVIVEYLVKQSIVAFTKAEKVFVPCKLLTPRERSNDLPDPGMQWRT